MPRPRLQAVKRDFAFTVPAGLTADALTRAVKGADKAAITAARVFDLFERDGVTSMAVEVTLQPVRQELHRRRPEGDRRCGRRRGGEVGREPAWLIRSRSRSDGLSAN